MADSIRKQIIDAAVAALEGITNIGDVGSEYKDAGQYTVSDTPACCVLDEETTFERSAYLHDTAHDMSATMSIRIRAYEFDINNSLASKRTELIKEIELALIDDSSLAALITDIVPERLDTDYERVENWAIIDFYFTVEYDYNHNTP